MFFVGAKNSGSDDVLVLCSGCNEMYIEYIILILYILVFGCDPSRRTHRL